MDPRPAILDRVAQTGGAVFERGPYNLNLIGVRSPTPEAGRFDDRFYAVYRHTDGGPWVVDVWACTTDPGTYWLEHPGNVAGTAILCPGQYRGTWEIGRHRGEYEALVQRKPVRVWRDVDRDRLIEGKGRIYEGMFGINIHRASSRTPSVANERWSAGCQVLQNPVDFAALMALCSKSAALYGPRFTYTLLEDAAPAAGMAA